MGRPAFPYIDGLIAAWRAGQTGRDVHLGYWDRPPDLATPAAPGEFVAAQARLTERIIALAPLAPGQRVLDVACGLGGTLAAIAARLPRSTLVGVNIDRRQLEICRGVAPPAGGGRPFLVEADACALPFADASFDEVFCVEAIFHFRSRRVFLAEAARLLRPGGTLVLSDILARQPGAAAPWGSGAMAAALRRGYGAWPELWVEAASVRQSATDTGLRQIAGEDWSAQTLPSYRIVAPDEVPWRRDNPEAGHVLRWLHAGGWLTYQIFVFRKPGGF
jgi:MPBQ/MSBQ methyltransferase